MIPIWVAKAVVQKGISFLPYASKINYLFQKYVTKGVELNEAHFTYKITHAGDHLKFFHQYGAKRAAHVLELGTGWYPIVPIALFLNDVESTTSIDIAPWMTQASQVTAIRKTIEWRKAGKLSEHLPYINEDKWQVLENIAAQPHNYSFDQINEAIRLKPLQCDAQKMPFPDHSFDAICSNNTFEHVHKQVLFNILKEFKRVVKPGGVMSHFIDMSDHFAHFDHSITIYNFLQYSEKRWKLIDNNIQPQNRMRFPAYKAMYDTLNIPYQEEGVRPGDLSLLHSVKIHPEFAGYGENELAVSHGYLVSKM